MYIKIYCGLKKDQPIFILKFKVNEKNFYNILKRFTNAFGGIIYFKIIKNE